MIIKCGVCGQNIEVEGGIEDGQKVLCPFCGEKSVFSRPKRIELPIGFESLKRSASAPNPVVRQPVSLPEETATEPTVEVMREPRRDLVSRLFAQLRPQQA